MPQKTINTRIQLKNDTEVNWKKSVLEGEGGTKTSGTSFVPLQGELIIYSADDAHPFSRLKVGDGITNVVRLPFIDAGTINGNNLSESILLYDTTGDFPRSGESNKLYIDLANNRIFCFATGIGYKQLTHFTNKVTTQGIKSIKNWAAGTMTAITVENNKLVAVNGTAPNLELENLTVVTNIQENPPEVINNANN